MSYIALLIMAYKEICYTQDYTFLGCYHQQWIQMTLAEINIYKYMSVKKNPRAEAEGQNNIFFTIIFTWVTTEFLLKFLCFWGEGYFNIAYGDKVVIFYV